MKTFSLTLALAIAALFSAGPALCAKDKDVSSEPLGKLVLGKTSGAIVKLLGEPESKGQDTRWEAIGEWVQEWKFTAKGLSLGMASDKKGGTKTLYSITASSGCPFATGRGIKIGSTEADTRKAYAKEEEKDQSRFGQTFVAGSIYGGVIFTFKEGKVTRIFIGAAAE